MKGKGDLDMRKKHFVGPHLYHFFIKTDTDDLNLLTHSYACRE